MSREKFRQVVPPWAAFLAAVVVFLPILWHPFLDWDDHLTLAGNPWFNPPDFEGLMSCWGEPHLALYVPVTYSVWWLVATMAQAREGLVAGWFHAVSLLAHALTAAVVAVLVRRAVEVDRGDGGDKSVGWRAAVAGAMGGVLFAVHPVQVESVAWASGLKDVLAGLLGWGAVWGVVRALEAGGRKRVMWWVGAGVSLGMAMLAKPSAVAFPVAGGVVLVLVMGVAWKRVVAAVVVGMLMAVPVGMVAKAVQPPNDVAVGSLGMRVLGAGDSLAFYVRHVAAPWPLAVDYGRAPQVQAALPLVGVMWVVPLGLVVLVWVGDRVWGARRGGGAAGGGGVGGGWGMVGGVVAAGVLLGPVWGLVPFQFQRYSSVADHYLYSAMGAVAMVVGVGVGRVWMMVPRGLARWVVVGGMGVGVVGVYGGVAAWYVRKWGGTEVLFEHNARAVPASFAAQRVLGFLAARRGEDGEAERYMRGAIELRGDDVESRFNLANLYLRRRDLEAARGEYERLLELKPDLAGAVQNLGVTYELMGRSDLARGQYLKLMQMDPGNQAAGAGLRRNLPEGLMNMLPSMPQLGPTTGPGGEKK